jgi:hypothetical protein
MFNSDKFAEEFMNHVLYGGSLPKKAGREGMAHPCKNRKELGDWFTGFSLACRDVRPKAEPVS